MTLDVIISYKLVARVSFKFSVSNINEAFEPRFSTLRFAPLLNTLATFSVLFSSSDSPSEISRSFSNLCNCSSHNSSVRASTTGSGTGSIEPWPAQLALVLPEVQAKLARNLKHHRCVVFAGWPPLCQLLKLASLAKPLQISKHWRPLRAPICTYDLLCIGSTGIENKGAYRSCFFR